jgi:hypothetical protein
MSSERDTTRIVESWLEEGVAVLPDRVLNAVIAQLPATEQRRAGWLARRFPIMNRSTMRFGVAAVVVIAAAIAGLSFVPGMVGGPDATPTPTTVPSVLDSLTPSPTADLGIPLLAEQPTYPSTLEPGTYLIDAPFPVRASLTVPEGWSTDGLRKEAVGLGPLTATGAIAGWGLAFKDIDDVFVDPCATDQRLRNVGPTADELVAALLDLPGYDVADPVPVTVGGVSGQRIDISVPELSGSDCQGGHPLLWTMSGLTFRGLTGDVYNLIVLEIQDRRLVIEIDDYAHSSVWETETYGTPFDPEAHAQDLVELHQMLDSIQFH